jgi:WD40 repeat protein
MKRPLRTLLACVSTLFVVAMPASAGDRPDDAKASYRAHLAATVASMRLGEPAEAQRWLAGAPKDQRGWEWHHLDTLLDQSRTMRSDLPAIVFSVHLNPAGSLAAVALTNGAILLIDTATGATTKELPGHPGGTFCARFNHDGTKLASGGTDRIARVWDVTTGAALVEFKEHRFPVTSVIFSADGTRIFSSAYFVNKETPIEGRVHQWNAETGELLRTYRGGVKPLSSLALSPDGALVAAGSWDSCAFVWNVDGVEGEAPRTFGGKPGPLQNVHINTVAFSPDGSLLAAGSDSAWAKVYRVADGTEVANLKDGDANIGAVAFAPNGATLALGGDNGAVTLWNTHDWSREASLMGHTLGVRALAWSREAPTGTSVLYSAGTDRSLRAWDPAYPRYGGLRGHYGENNYSVAFSRDGKLLACSSSDGTIGTVDTTTGKETARFPTAHTKEVCTAAISPDGARIASCSWDGSLRVHDVASGKELGVVTLPSGAAYFAWHPDGRRAAVALNDKTAVIVDTTTLAIERVLTGHTGAVKTVAWNADGSRLLSGSSDASARVWDTASGECVATMKARTPAPVTTPSTSEPTSQPPNQTEGHEGTIESGVFVPGSSLAATASHDGSVRLWDATTGRQIRILMESDDAQYRIAASPDGKRLASGGERLSILDPASTGSLLRERPVKGSIWHLDWSPDGQRLAIGSWNGEIVIFDGHR